MALTENAGQQARPAELLADPAAPAERRRPRRWAKKLLPSPGPQRVLAAATLVNTFGSGLFVTSSALYFTRVIGLPTTQVAVGLTAGGIVGLLAGMAGGRIADRWGAKRTQIAVMVLGAFFMTCYLFVHTFWAFIAVACLTAAVHSANPTSRDPLVRQFGGDRPAAYRAYLQAMTNLAIALGAVVAGAAIQADSPEAYTSLLVGRTLAFIGCALVLTRLPGPPPNATRAAEKVGWVALRNRPFLVATVINGVMEMHYAVPTFALPLWIVDHTNAPRWTVSVILLLNTAMVAGLQVMAGRSVSSAEDAGKRMLWAGCALSTGLVLMAAADGPTAWVSALTLVVATAVYTLGELWHAAASMEYSFGFASAEAQGQYSGVFRLGAGTGDALAPTVMGVLVLSWGRPGWLVLALLFLLVGAVSRPAVAFASRRSLR
ncbi:MFS transporter [Streptomyces sp. NPDC086023]|uniref:MFS transporter n=1 Tax=Streptomyces sp. NPDC086023 TaxID=3365746 RepID=UPI0037D34195